MQVVYGTVRVFPGTAVANLLTGEKLAWPEELVTTAYRQRDLGRLVPRWWFYWGEGLFDVDAADVEVLEQGKSAETDPGKAYRLPAEGQWLQLKGAAHNREQIRKWREEKKRRTRAKREQDKKENGSGPGKS